MKTKTQRVLAGMLALMLLLCGMTSSVSAESPAEKYKRLKEELESTRALISDYKDNIQKQKEYKKQLETEKTIIDQMVEVNHQEVERTNREMDHKQEQVAANREVLYENDQLLRERLVAIYNMNSGNTLSRLLAVESATEFFAMSDALQRISKHDTELLELLSDQREALVTQEAEIDTLLEELKAYRDELLKNQEDLANNIMAADASITKAQANLAAQQEIEGDQKAALAQAQREMAALASRMGGSSKGDGSEFVGGAFTWPVPGVYRITCEFGAPDPNGAGHRGMDIGAPNGTPIVACGAGTVIVASYAHSSYGNYLVIDHGDGVKTLYAHCSGLSVSAGQQVSTGQNIGSVGSTGFSTGPHLHLEVHNGGLENPRKWLQG